MNIIFSAVAHASRRAASTVVSTLGFVFVSLERHIDTNVDAARLEAYAT